MKSDSNSKQYKYQNQSLLTLNSNIHGEAIKKQIQYDNSVNFHPTATSNNLKYIFTLPINAQISTIIQLMTTKFSEQVVHAEQDGSGGHIILTGISNSGIRRWLAKSIDVFTFCFRKAGSKHGSVEQTYNIISIHIKKQIIQQRCSLIVSNPYRQPFRHSIFLQNIIGGIQQQLQSIHKQTFHSINQTHKVWINPYLSASSPVQLEIHIYKKIFNLYIFYDKEKQFNRFKILFKHSVDKIRQQIEKHRKRLVNNGPINKSSFTNPSCIVEKFIIESQILMDNISNCYRDEDLGTASYLYSLLRSDIQRDISLYTIETTLCLQQLHNLKQIYELNNKQQCQAFNKQIQYLNQQYSDEACFNHLELRDKFRLPNEKRPYYSSIQILKGVINSKSLRQMLLVIQKTFSNIKTDCLMSHAGKLQVVSMDDLLPVMIFVTVRAKIRNFPLFVKLIDDYVRLKSVFELQQRVITTLYVAIQDISKPWTIKQLVLASIPSSL